MEPKRATSRGRQRRNRSHQLCRTFAVLHHRVCCGAGVGGLATSGSAVLRVRPVAVANGAASPFPHPIENEILHGAVEIGAAVRNRAAACRVDTQPKLLKNILRLDRVARAGDQEAKQLLPILYVYGGESGLRSVDESFLSFPSLCPRWRESGKSVPAR